MKGEGGGCGKRNFTLHNCGTCHFCWCQTFPAVSKALLCWIYWIVFWKIESGELNIHITMLIHYFNNQDVSVKGAAKIFETHKMGWGLVGQETKTSCPRYHPILIITTTERKISKLLVLELKY